MPKGKNKSQHAKLPVLAGRKHNGRSNEDDPRRAALTMQSKTGTLGEPTDRRIETAIRIMRRQDGRSLSIRELARQVNLSACHFTHLFRSEMSISPKQYIRVLRIEQARELLIDSFWTVKQVASMVGSGDRSHFCRHFKSVFGQAPSDFRRSEQLGFK
jgi:transcriptional regulator GlxA family with amidase domain